MSFKMTVAWGDCDSLGIVYYPNFFRWFDTSFQHLLASKDLDQRKLVARFDTLGTPLANVDARFINPATYGDEIVVDSHITDWKDKLFTVTHVVRRGEDTLAEGHELRFWGARDSATGKLKAAQIDPEFKSIMSD